MSKSKEGEKALKAITKARTMLIVGNPFYGCLALHLKLVEIEDEKICSTMMVDGKHLAYWPPFVNSLTEPELVGVVAHEVTHCSYQHFVRIQQRDHDRWNVAGDFVINQDIKEAGFVLPGKPVTLKELMNNAKFPFHLLDPAFKGMSTEEVYSQIPEVQKVKLRLGIAGGNDIAGCGGVESPKDGGGAAGREELGRDWEILVRQAINVARSHNAGKLPGYLQRLVDELDKPRVSWKELTRDFIDGNMNKDYSWARPNRRLIARGTYLPGFIPDSLNHLVMVADNSGSISGEVLKAMVSEGAGALDEGTCDKLTIIYADDGVRHVDEFLPGDVVKAKMLGGGGTNFRPTFEWIKEHASDASCVVYLTDMETGDWGDEPHCPVMWACFHRGGRARFDQLKDLPPFGRSIFVDGI